jgi:hypothetical protein
MNPLKKKLIILRKITFPEEVNCTSFDCKNKLIFEKQSAQFIFMH